MSQHQNDQGKQKQKPRSSKGRFTIKKDKTINPVAYFNNTTKRQLNKFAEQCYTATNFITFFILFDNTKLSLEVFPSSIAVQHLTHGTIAFNEWIEKHGDTLWKAFKMSQHDALAESMRNYTKEREATKQLEERLLHKKKETTEMLKQIQELEAEIQSTQ
eukprot:520075_1